jgi:hypothetical protein
MKNIRTSLFLWLFLFITTACGNQSIASDLTETPAFLEPVPAKINPGSGAFFTIDEVGLGPNGHIALTNFTDNPADLAGLNLCQGFACYDLPDVVVNAGETIRIATGDGAGLEKVAAVYATIGELHPSDGEVVLATEPLIQEPGEILLYLQWGSTPHQFTELAVQAGLWLEGSYAPSSQNATRLFKVKDTGLWLFDEP